MFGGMPLFPAILFYRSFDPHKQISAKCESKENIENKSIWTFIGKMATESLYCKTSTVRSRRVLQWCSKWTCNLQVDCKNRTHWLIIQYIVGIMHTLLTLLSMSNRRRPHPYRYGYFQYEDKPTLLYLQWEYLAWKDDLWNRLQILYWLTWIPSTCNTMSCTHAPNPTPTPPQSQSMCTKPHAYLNLMLFVLSYFGICE